MARAGEVLRALPYPVLVDGNLSYPEGEYAVDVLQTDDTSVTIRHKVRNVPFLDRLIRQGQARYGCLIAVPLTGHRKLHLSDEERQHIKLDMTVVGEPPMLRPLIVSVAEISRTLGSDSGAAEVWQGREITFPKGARLALRGYLRPSSSVHELLQINRNEQLPAGSFEVAPCTDDGFYFKVSAASDLCQFLQNAGEHKNHRGSILTHIVSRCFEILRKDYSGQSEDGGREWEQYSNLKALAADLEGYDLPLWDADNFSADLVATKRYPHKPSQTEPEG